MVVKIASIFTAVFGLVLFSFTVGFTVAQNCPQNVNPVVDHLVDAIRPTVLSEKVSFPIGQASIENGRIVQLGDLKRVGDSCASNTYSTTLVTMIPFIVHIVEAKAEADVHVLGFDGKAYVTFSVIELVGQLSVDVSAKKMQLVEFAIAKSEMSEHRIEISWLVKWVVALLRSFFAGSTDNDIGRGLVEDAVKRCVGQFDRWELFNGTKK